MTDESVTDEPRFIENDYESRYSDPCQMLKDGLEKLCKGSGISPASHPLKEFIRFRNCGNCKSKTVKVLYARWVVHPMSGDAYWDYEIYCEKCKKYTQRSFTEN